jgi:hypothetical protein
MTDRELLELAAKAAYAETATVKNGYGLFVLRVMDAEGGWSEDWNPMEDDGDALRLAVSLKLEFEWWKNGLSVARDDLPPQPIEHEGTDPCAATRRAIVRAAAEIGKAMKGEPHAE